MFIAVDLKVIEGVASATARAANVSEDRVLAGLVRLWHRCWSQTSDTIDPMQLAGVMGGDRILEVSAALVAHGFLESLPDGFRVRGATRYLRLKASRREGARKTNSARSKSVAQSRSKSAPERTLNDALPPNTEHRAPSTLKETAAPTGEHQATVAAVVEAFATHTGAKYPFGARDAVVVKRLLSGNGREAIVSAWTRALTHTGWPTVRTLAQLEQHLAHFVGAGPPTSRGAAAPAQPAMNFTNSVTEGF